MASRAFAYTTKELSKETWPDFARLFSGGGGWDFCWRMHFQRAYASSKDNRLTTRKNKILQTRAARSVRNRREKKRLVEQGVAHGILVYAHGEPVGWCQYGPREELPRIDNYRKYRALASGRATERLWRITCFVVDRKVRRRGIARAALRAALDAIRKKGGGLPDHSLESGNLRKRVDAWHRVDVREGGVQHRRPFWRDQIPDKCVSAKERLSVVRLERGLSRSLSSGARSQIYPGLAEGLYQILTVVLFTEDGVLVHAAMRGWARCGCSGMCFSWSRS